MGMRAQGVSADLSSVTFQQSRKKHLRVLLKKYRVLYAIMAVIMGYYVLFNYVPIIMGIMISFKELKVGGTIMAAPWIGFENYRYVLTDSEIWKVIRNTLILSTMRLFWGFWPPIILAIAIYDIINRTYKRFCQTIVYVPHFFSWVIVYGIVFAFFSGSGFINTVRALLGAQRIDFLMSTEWFRPLLVGSQIWKSVGWGTILYFAALTSVNPELYEAARIDGAGPIRRTLAVTLPAMMPVVTFSLIMALGSILNNDFEQVLMFYNPAVYSVGDIIDTWVYRVGLAKFQYGIGSAVGLMKAFISLILILGANTFARRVSGRGMW